MRDPIIRAAIEEVRHAGLRTFLGDLAGFVLIVFTACAWTVITWALLS